MFTQPFEIIDAQVHLNQLVPDWRTAPIDNVIATGLEAMDAVGIHKVLIGEARGFDSRNRPAGQVLPNGAVRSDYPFSERAVERHPDRFVYHVRVDRNDPDLEQIVSAVRQKPGAHSLRIVPVPQTGEVDSLARGEFERLFAAAEQYHVAVFAWLPGRAHLLEPYAKKFPKLQFIIDHCGVGVAPIRIGELPVTMATSLTPTLQERVKELEKVCELARYPNIAVKWCHAPGLLTEQEYPWRDILPHLRRAIDAFGVERIMWASDYTVARDQNGQTWAQTLYYLLDSEELSVTEKEWIFGRSLRKALNWSE